MPHLWSDIRFGVRMLARYPTLSVVSILTFGLGLGLATAVFSLVNGALYKGLPFEDPSRIVIVAGTNAERGIRRGPVSVHDLVVFRDRQTVFEKFGGFQMVPVNLSGDGLPPQRFEAAAVSVALLDALRANPVLGRRFRHGEDQAGAEPVMLIGYRLWQQRYSGSREVLGKSIRANGMARTIVGIMPDGFAFPNLEELWIPLVLDPLSSARGQGPFYRVAGRLRPDVTIAEAQAQFSSIATNIAREFPNTNHGAGVRVLPFVEGVLGAQLFPLLYTMLAAGIGVLLIACVNVSNLLLARASLRQREVAVRLALGAGRFRVLAQILTEVAVLAAAGALLGLLVSVASMRWFVTAVQSNPPPFFITFGLDVRVLLFVTGVTAAAAVFSGLLPALQATRLNIASTLKDEGRAATGFRAARFSGLLTVAEMTVSCALLIAAGLMVKSISQVGTVRLPFTIDSISTARISLPESQYTTRERRIRFFTQLLPKVQAIPGVDAATLSDDLPASGYASVAIQLPGRAYRRETDYPVVRRGLITPGHFKTFQASTIRGRDFTDFDESGKQMVAIVNETFARRFWGGADPIGRVFREAGGDSSEPWLSVVGVVPDMLMQGFGNAIESGAGFYRPIAQSDVGFSVNIAVRGSAATQSLVPRLRAAVASLDPDLALYEMQPMQNIIDQTTMFYWAFGTFFLAFGIAGLFLAAAGLYGVMSFSVTERTREFGIRSALGALNRQLMLLVMRRAIVQSTVGLALGLALGLLIAEPLRPFLYQVDRRDPAVLMFAVVALAATGVLTGLFATWRITRLDPMIALASE